MHHPVGKETPPTFSGSSLTRQRGSERPKRLPRKRRPSGSFQSRLIAERNRQAQKVRQRVHQPHPGCSCGESSEDSCPQATCDILGQRGRYSKVMANAINTQGFWVQLGRAHWMKRTPSSPLCHLWPTCTLAQGDAGA